MRWGVLMGALIVLIALVSPAQSVTADCTQQNAFDNGVCCCWIGDPTGGHAYGHVMDLGTVMNGGDVSFEIRPGAGDAGCHTTGYMYYSLDGSAWTLFWSSPNLAGWTTYSGSAHIDDSFRYIRANTDGCSVDWSYVSVQGAINQPPVAVFKSLNIVDGDGVEGPHMAGGQIVFDPSESYDPDGQIVKYEWNFGNGQTVAADQPNEYIMTYVEPEKYDVTLTVVDDQGLTGTASEELDLTLLPGDLIVIRSGPPYSTIFNVLGGQTYTHVGMYVGTLNGVHYMVESAMKPVLPGSPVKKDGVQLTKFSRWSNQYETYADAVRVNVDQETRNRAVAWALSRQVLGLKYDLNSITENTKQVDASSCDAVEKGMRNVCRAEARSYYCSELVWAAYYRASNGQIDLSQPYFTTGAIPPDGLYPNILTEGISWHHEDRP